MGTLERSIISALRAGIPPEEGVERFSVGRRAILERFHQDLERVENGHSALRYISADIGLGKTHLLRLLRSQAFGKDFVVTEVELSTSRCPLFNLLDVYRHIMLGLRTAQSPREPALEVVLDRWLEFQRRASPADRARSLGRLPLDLQAALLSYLNATNFLRPWPQRRDAVLRWLIGERLPLAQRDPIELYDNIGDVNALAMLAAISQLFRDIGYGGICILFDEAESLVSFSRSKQKDRAVLNLTRLVRAAGTTVGCYFVYATTPSFVDAYGARPEFRPAGADGTALQLEALSPEDVKELIDLLIKLYCEAFGDVIPDGWAGRIRTALSGRATARVSDLTRAIISSLDEIRDGSAPN